MKPLRVLIVEDSMTVRNHLFDALCDDPKFTVVGQCVDGETALRFLEDNEVDVISLDMMLPGKSGLDVTRCVVASRATPILIVSASVNRGEAMTTLDALNAGAVDVFDKSVLGSGPGWEVTYKSALTMAARIRVVRRPQARGEVPLKGPLPFVARSRASSSEVTAVVMGASTGGPSAVAHVLTALPQDFPLPVLVVIHMAPLFAKSLVEWLQKTSGRPVRLATDNEPLPAAGSASPVIVAPPDRHLVIRDGRLRLIDTPERHACRPAVDELFESAARELGARALGVLLTGMGRDGASGLLALHQAGSATICQNQETCAVFGMPRVAIELGAAGRVLPLNQIAPAIVEDSLVVAKRSQK